MVVQPGQLASVEEDELSITKAVDLWKEVRTQDELAWLVQTAQVYDFKEVLLSTGKRKWEEAIIDAADEHGYPVPPAATWAAFCIRHLKMSPGQASALKRIWETYVVQCGYTPAELQVAGKGKLTAAAAEVDRGLPARNAVLEEALFGAPNRCNACSTVVPLPAPAVCPGCSTPWEPVTPLTYAETLSLLAKIKAARKGEGAGEGGALQWDYEMGERGDTIRELFTWVVGETRFPLPVRVMNVLSEDEAGDGIPESYLAEYIAYMKGKHK